MKRFFDISCSLIGLIFLTPALLVISLLIELTSKGPAIYTQTRVGKGNNDFKIAKFRSMTLNADAKGLLTVGSRDKRITRIGYYLRKYKLDELPQLFNILRGDMSFVGPRPEVRKYVSLYNPKQQLVLSVRPGLTDYASIKFMDENELLKNSNDPEQLYIDEIMPLKLNLNLIYIENKSFLMDVKIILKTILAIIYRKKK